MKETKMDIREKMVDDLGRALSKLNKRNRNSLWLRELTEADTDGVVEFTVGDFIDMSAIPVVQGLQQKGTLSDVACTIGRKIRQKAKLPQDSLCSLFGGLLILETFASVNFLGVRRTFGRGAKKKKHPPYHIVVKDYGNFQLFLEAIDMEKLDEAPLKEPAADWNSGVHVDGKTIVRHGNPVALKKFSPENQPLVLNALNKLQRTGYAINENVFRVYLQCLKMPSGSPFKYEKETNQEAKKSMQMEASAIRELAAKNLHNNFFHRYSCDFRGRIYPGTAYLNEQSSDNAKGLLIYDHEVPFGENGAWFLAVHTANSIGEDKLPLQGRVQYVNENMAEIVSWAEAPMMNRGWMDADKPWSALACAFEWKRIDQWARVDGLPMSEFRSALPVFIDGSNNGVQHLTALALDETVCHLVNLNSTECLETSVPGDIYMFIADKVWERLEKLEEGIPQEDREQMQRLLDELKAIRIEYDACGTQKKKRDEVYKKLAEWRKENRELIRKLWPTFWQRVDKRSTRRKCVKRPVMTLG